MQIEEIDFSGFHPLDHWPGTRQCSSLPGGTWNHLKLTWTFRRHDQLLKPFRRMLGCPFGRHHMIVWYTQDTVLPECSVCGFERVATEEEVLRRPSFFY